MKIALFASMVFFLTNFLFAQTPGNSLHFNGVNNNVSTTLPTVFTNIPSNDISVEAWIYPEGNGFSRVLFAQQNAANFVSLSMASGNIVYFYVSNVQSANTTTSIPANQWSHVACVWNSGLQQIQIYFNGILQPTVGGGSSSTGNDNLMTIGSRTNNAQYFPGSLDELRIWDIALSPCEIQARMNSEFSSTLPNLVAYYKFNEGVAGGTNTGVTTLPDLTTSYNGTLNGFTLNGATSNWITSGAAITMIDQTTNSGTDVQSSCGPLLWIDGNTYATNNNTATYTFVNGASNGCDSIVTLDLTINLPASGSDIQSACGTYQWIDGNTYTTNNNTATYTYVNGAANGCDSIVTLDLTINVPTSGTDVQSACGDFLWIDGNTYTSNNNTATYTYVNGAANGCDSLVTLDLTINSVNTATSTSGITMTANAVGAIYQWLDCDNGFALITGATAMDFTPSMNGNYAVQVTENGCSDTSACTTISTIGIIENSLGAQLNVYPNPTSGQLSIQLGESQARITASLFTMAGQLIKTNTFSNTSNLQLILDQPVGVYLLELSNSSGQKALIRVIKD